MRLDGRLGKTLKGAPLTACGRRHGWVEHGYRSPRVPHGVRRMGLALPKEAFSAVQRFGYGSNAKQNV
jgi:hypothetical protein